MSGIQNQCENLLAFTQGMITQKFFHGIRARFGMLFQKMVTNGKKEGRQFKEVNPDPTTTEACSHQKYWNMKENTT